MVAFKFKDINEPLDTREAVLHLLQMISSVEILS